MADAYGGWHARWYDALWRGYTGRTLAQALALIDAGALAEMATRRGRPAHALDVACGTGVLLRALLARAPDVEATGVDASAVMLARARERLRPWPSARLIQARLGAGTLADLPFESGAFDLITCTNALHYLVEPAATLTGLRHLLAEGGLLVLEDYARRPPPFPWRAFEGLVRRVDRGHVRAYTLAQARALCGEAGLAVRDQRAFAVGWLWHGWALCAAGAHGAG